MKRTIILISALFLTLIISGPAFAQNINYTGNPNELGSGGSAENMTGIDLSPSVAMDYEGNADNFAIATWNIKGNRVFAAESSETTIYFYDVDTDNTSMVAVDDNAQIATADPAVIDNSLFDQQLGGGGGGS